MLELPNVKRVIAIEQAWRYLPLLKVMSSADLRIADRLAVATGEAAEGAA